MPRVWRDLKVDAVVRLGQARAGNGEVTTRRISPRSSCIVEANAHGKVIGSSLGWGVANNEAAPCLVTLVDDLGGVLFVLGLARERKGVFALAIGNLVDPVCDHQSTHLQPEKKEKENLNHSLVALMRPGR